VRALSPLLALLIFGCAAPDDQPLLGGGDAGGNVTDSTAGDAIVEDSTAFDPEVLPPTDAITGSPSRVYANTDKDLYQMDPATKAVTKIGSFVGPAGAAFTDTMTDVAVNADGKLWGNSVGKVFELTLPPSGSGDVVATQRVSIPSGLRFYALAFAPKGVLGPNEELIGGDAAGDIYWIPASGTPTKIGGFGTVAAGDPGLGAAGNFWQLSGDIAFFLNDGAPIGLATLRPCTTDGDPSTCKNGNDVVVEIDVAALSKKSATSNLKKRFIGASGTGFGRLYGVGAWGDKIYAFQRISTTGGMTTALLVEVSLADGKGTMVKDFPDVAAAKNGWSGAGVTTSARVFIPK